jgi:cullin-4
LLFLQAGAFAPCFATTLQTLSCCDWILVVALQLSCLQGQTQLAPSAFLEPVSDLWDDYCSQMLMIRSIFLYLDRTYVINLPGLRSLFDTGLASLRQHLAAHPKVMRLSCAGQTDA